MRACEGCTLCCTLLAVPALEKRPCEVCRHQTTTGCNIFGEPIRPAMCRSYQCAWLQNATWDDALRPDRCGVVFEPFVGRNMAAAVDPMRPASWSAGPARAAIDQLLAANVAVIVVVGQVKHVLLPEGRTPSQVWDDVDRAVRHAAWPPRPIQQT